MDISLEEKQYDAKTKLLKRLLKSVAKDGFQQLRMDDISKCMDVSRATMYKYFSSKEDVISGIVRIYVDYIERLVIHYDYEEEVYFGICFQELFEQSTSLIEYVTDSFTQDLQSAYPDLHKTLMSTLQKRDQQSLQFYRLGKERGIFNPINETFILLQDILLLREVTSVKYLLSNQITIQNALYDFYQLKKIQLFKYDKLSLVDDSKISSVIDKLAEKFNPTLI